MLQSPENVEIVGSLDPGCAQSQIHSPSSEIRLSYGEDILAQITDMPGYAVFLHSTNLGLLRSYRKSNYS